MKYLLIVNHGHIGHGDFSFSYNSVFSVFTEHSLIKIYSMVLPFCLAPWTLAHLETYTLYLTACALFI
jgi:hypothetical protein